MVVPSILVAYLFNYNLLNFQTLTLCSTLVIAVTFLGTTISAIILPYTKPDLYRSSPIAQYNVLGIPLISVAGVIFGGFLVFLLYQWIFDPNGLYGIGITNTSSVIYMLANYALAPPSTLVSKPIARAKASTWAKFRLKFLLSK
jgi:basic amino acid/polyamine antiporter, APA family